MRIAVVCPDAFTAWNFHRSLLLALRSRGHEVHVIAAPNREVDVRHLTESGLGYIPLGFQRFISPRADLAVLARLYSILRSHRFDCVHSFNLKSFIYGTIIAHLAGVPRIFGTIEGLGFAYTEATSLKARLLVFVMNALNLVAGRLADKVWFLNSEDRQFFVSRHMIAAQDAVLVKSCGIKLQDFSDVSIDSRQAQQLRAELGVLDGAVLVTMVVARAVWSKGVREFVEAGLTLGREHPAVRFVLLAPVEEDSPQTVPPAYLRAAECASRSFRWLSTFRDDVRELLSISDIFVLPSYYREGVPRTLLEAMAMGKPIVTTDNVGCRDVVDDGATGFLVPVRSPQALAGAIRRLVEDPHLRRQFGSAARRKVEREFADSVIVPRVLQELYGEDNHK
jgi:N,N'-diacetylbacillosaminyl-diphospho-undecaprenol alpha-1,3-N-acetylgalactosaminyltransferase